MPKRLTKSEKKLAMEQYEKDMAALWEQTKDKQILSFLMVLSKDPEVERFELCEISIYIYRHSSPILRCDERKTRVSILNQLEFTQDMGCYLNYNDALQKERERIGQEALAKQKALAKLTVEERKLLGIS